MERERERVDLFASLVFFNLSCWGVESWSRVQRFDFQLSIPGSNLGVLGLEPKALRFKLRPYSPRKGFAVGLQCLSSGP